MQRRIGDPCVGLWVCDTAIGAAASGGVARLELVALWATGPDITFIGRHGDGCTGCLVFQAPGDAVGIWGFFVKLQLLVSLKPPPAAPAEGPIRLGAVVDANRSQFERLGRI
jgi:hypothetical protein